MTPDEIKEALRVKRGLARYRFKSLVRRVIYNRHWLSEVEETKIGENVRRNVQIIVRAKHVGTLTLIAKRILNTPPGDRTEEDRRTLLRVISNLKMFNRYPPRLRGQIAQVCHYEFFNKGRTIVREGQPSFAVYFIVDGEITVLQRVYDPLDKTYKNKTVGAMGAGDMFGEVSCLFNTKRTATCVTASNCEFLCLYKEEFDLILRDILQTQWDQIKLAIDRFEYFKPWTRKQIEECCVVSRIKQYNPQQLMYSEDRGILNYCHFVLSGQCMILQCLKMRQYTDQNGKKSYELIKLEEEDKSDLHLKYSTNAENPENVMRHISNITNLENLPSEILENASRYSSKPIDMETAQIFRKPKVDTIHRFVDVGSLSCGSVFAIGEKLEQRAIIARNTVQCLLIPRFWLFQNKQNIGNIWYRTKMYIETSVPSRQLLFEDFLRTMKWLKFRKDLVQDITSVRQNYNPTSFDDVPMICRIEENLLDDKLK